MRMGMGGEATCSRSCRGGVRASAKVSAIYDIVMTQAAYSCHRTHDPIRRQVVIRAGWETVSCSN